MYNKNRISLGIIRSSIYLVLHCPVDFGQVTLSSPLFFFFLAIQQHGRIAEWTNEIRYM